MRFCTYCGFTLSGAPGYCGGCGTPIDEALGNGSSPALTAPIEGPPVPPPGQGPPDPWGRHDAPRLWPQGDAPGPWPQPDTPGPWSSQAAPGPPAHQAAPGPWPQPDTSEPLPGQSPPYPWGRQDTSGSWPSLDPASPGPRQNAAGTWTHQDTSRPGPFQDAGGSRTREQPAPPSTAPDLFDDIFGADRPPGAGSTEFLAPAGLLTDDSPRRDKTKGRLPRTAGRAPGRASGRHGVMILAVLATLAALAAGGLGAWWISGHNSRVRPTSAGLQTASPSASRRGAPQSAAASDAVAIAPGLAREPAARGVTAFLKTYFGAINSHNYGVFSSLFVPQIRESLDHFNAGYRSTTDAGARLTGLSTTGAQSLAATVTFTSHQNPADSPNHAACDTWNVVLSLDSTGAGYLIAPSPAGYQPSVQACH
jgi:hypothetical protein